MHAAALAVWPVPTDTAAKVAPLGGTPTQAPPTLELFMRWDIFCLVIDNHGDLGVCWRLARELAARGQQVRLWVDQPQALHWMAPQPSAAIELVHWRQPPSTRDARRLPDGTPLTAQAADVVIEAFGCDIDPQHIMLDAARPPRWLNLEYLSAQSYVERNHGLPSPVMSGPAAGQRKHFFYPGFTARTGGLLREAGLAQRQQQFDGPGWRRRNGLPGAPDGSRLVSLFCYEPAQLPGLLQHWSNADAATRLLVTPGRAQAAVQAAGAALGWPANSAATRTVGALTLQLLPYCSQPEFDELLWSCQLNFVRGEDSLVRAIWAARPFVWQIYPQHDGAHLAKLDAFLSFWLAGAPSDLQTLVRRWHHWWNHQPGDPGLLPAAPPQLSASQLDAWQQWADAARQRLWRQDDLCTQLIRFVEQTE
jgi:uncharacterized repeat protein (TIGR03837 family)